MRPRPSPRARGARTTPRDPNAREKKNLLWMMTRVWCSVGEVSQQRCLGRGPEIKIIAYETLHIRAELEIAVCVGWNWLGFVIFFSSSRIQMIGV